MPRRNTARPELQRIPFDGAPEGDPIADTYDAWQRCSARLLELERSLAADPMSDPRLDALIREVKVLRACTVELFVQVVGRARKDPAEPEPDASAATYVKGLAPIRIPPEYRGEP